MHDGHLEKGEKSAQSSEEPSSTLIGAVTAAGRAGAYQFTSFYLRAPMKLFRPARYDYRDYLKAFLHDSKNEPKKKVIAREGRFWNPKYTYYLENSTVGLLTRTLNCYGWKVIPERVLPPVLFNSLAGMVLYTTYLSSLATFTSDPNGGKGIHPAVLDVLKAGTVAGMAHALASAPVDAVHIRSSVSDLFHSTRKYSNLWLYGIDKFKEIGPIRCLGGLYLSLVKEGVGFAVYFGTFEWLKGQAASWALSRLEARQNVHAVTKAEHKELNDKEERWLQRGVVFIGGVTAALALQVVQYPLQKIHRIHIARLEAVDILEKSQKGGTAVPNNQLGRTTKLLSFNKRFHKVYVNSYADTYLHIRSMTKNTNTIQWLYKGFIRNALAIIPGTTAGLLLLECMRNTIEDTP